MLFTLLDFFFRRKVRIEIEIDRNWNKNIYFHNVKLSVLVMTVIIFLNNYAYFSSVSALTISLISACRGSAARLGSTGAKLAARSGKLQTYNNSTIEILLTFKSRLTSSVPSAVYWMQWFGFFYTKLMVLHKGKSLHHLYSICNVRPEDRFFQLHQPIGFSF